MLNRCQIPLPNARPVETVGRADVGLELAGNAGNILRKAMLISNAKRILDANNKPS